MTLADVAHRAIPDREQINFHEFNRMRRAMGVEPVTPADFGLLYELAIILERPLGLHPGLIWVQRSTGAVEPLPDEGWAAVELLRQTHWPNPGYIRIRPPDPEPPWTEVEFLAGYLGISRYAIWRRSGDIYTVGVDGPMEAVDDEPIALGDEVLRKIRVALVPRG